MKFYQEEIKNTIKDLDSRREGLNNNEINYRIKKYGKNEITQLEKVSIIKLLILQFRSFVVYILLAALVISILTSEFTDAIVIAIILVLNTVLGFYQEFKAEKAIEALKKLSSPKAVVIRNGRKISIDCSDVVPGDILIIEEGGFIAADSRLIEISDLQIDESTLTGESMPVSKTIVAIKTEKQIADQTNMVFAGTIVVRGRGKAVVVATGFDTELGKIAKAIQINVEKTTPLQKKLNKIGIYISIVVIIISLIVIFLDFIRDNFSQGIFESLKLGIAVAVAAIPEGLPAVVTITLALGTQRMLKKNALVRRLSAVETLGSTTVICTDKTGTLTKNEMTVTEIYSQNKLIDVSGRGYNTKGDFFYNNKKINTSFLNKLFQSIVLCNNASLDGPSDPTEKALIVVATKSKFKIESNRLEEKPFNSETKIMITLDDVGGKKLYHMKGAPEVVLKMCKFIDEGKEKKQMTKKELEKIIEVQHKMASKALRVLACAYSDKNKDYIFLGLVGMIDPPREEVKNSILKCKKAGIDVIMITGDYDITAKAIAKEIGIEGESITGEELDKITKKDLYKIINKIKIFSRVNPKHKVQILEALKENGQIVAMTGDGVNDALALKKSDIGTAVGDGTDVAKEASDIVIIDNNFTSIVDAVEEGRNIYNNIKKFILFLFSSNLAEVLIILFALIGGVFLKKDLPLPIIAIQLLWINIVTDGLPALALGVDNPNDNIMNLPPRNPKEKIITKYDTIKLIYQAIVMTACTLLIFFIFLKIKGLIYAQSMAFTTLVILELFNSVSYKIGDKTIISKEPFMNKYLLLAIMSSIVLQLVVIYLFPGIFKVVPLMLIDWVWVILAGLFILFINEVVKILYRKTLN